MFDRNNAKRFMLALAAAGAGGILFTLLGTPIPWLLGPMTAILLLSRVKNNIFYWPIVFRDAGLMVVGYSIGLSFTKDAAVQIFHRLPSMFFMTALLIGFCAAIALAVSKLTAVDYPTVLTGSIPGGLSQMIIFAEEMKGIDITTVTFLQISRLIMIVFMVPFMIVSPFFGGSGISHGIETKLAESAGVSLFPAIFLFGAVCILFTIAGKKIKSPTPVLLGPILGTAFLSILGVSGPAPSPAVLDVSQFMIGGYIGLLLQPEKLQNKARIISLALLSGFLMVVGSVGLSLLLSLQYGISHATAFLALAPGGMDQMAILAHEVDADLAMVTGYQLFRLFFIYFAIPPLLRMLFRKSMLRKAEA
ncbi:AbrB family transcriptional regulator [Mesobacillus zeae]|uniref:AbrB family transcriptional regulator n=1 Tax=Mesobacillus zeae TaxID=1917180 RepID=A0A398B8M9_9BACI|nr:AbrB family transcriptional regulator [Mesobacillus zeae]RID85844.1 AbrB family transcriptional regulator [Mesobacillus zeae]